jgi:hypothetical protein
MPNSSARAQGDVLLRLSVPPAGELRAIARDVAVKVAEYLGANAPDATSLAATLERSVDGLSAGQEQIEFVFCKSAGELLIEARAGGRTSEVRHPLPA